MNELNKNKASQEKSKLKVSKENEESGENRLSSSIDELLIVKKASILQKSKSDVSTSSSRGSRRKVIKSLDAAVAASSSDSSFGSALSANSSHEAITASELESFKEVEEDHSYVAEDSLRTSRDVEISNLVVGEIANLHLVDEDVPAHASDQSAFNLPSLPEEPSFSKISDELNNLSDDGVKSMVNEFLHVAVTETSEAEHHMSRIDAEHSQDIAEVLASVAVSQACLETMEETHAKRIQATEEQRAEEAAVNKALLERLCELQEFKDRLSGLVTSMENTYSDTYNALTQTHAYQLEASRLEAEKCRNELLNEIKEVTGKLVVSEAMVAGKDELVMALNDRIKNLEMELEKKEKHCKDELESLISKNMKNKTLMEAKDEIEMEDLIDQSELPLSDIDRAWLVSDLRRAESELSLNVGGEHQDAWMNSNVHCNFLTVHPLKGHEQNFDQTFASQEKKSKSKIPKIAKKITNPEVEALRLCKIEAESKNSELMILLDQYKSQLEGCEKEQVTVIIKNSSLENELESVKNKINELNSEKEAYMLEINQLKHELEISQEEKSVLWNEKNNNLSEIYRRNVELEDILSSLKAECEKLRERSASLDTEYSEVIKINKNTMADNLKLSEELNEALEKLKQLENVESQVEKLESELTLLQRAQNASVDLIRKLEEELKNTRSQLRGSFGPMEILRSKRESIEGRHSFESSRSGDSTVYMDYFPAPLMEVACETEETCFCSVSCQTERLPMDARYQQLEEELAEFKSTVDKLIAEKNKASERSLESELEASWTERCEVEEQLACALSEKSALTRRMQQIEEAGRRLMADMTTGCKSDSAWLKLFDNVKDIISDLAIISGYREEEKTDGGGERQSMHLLTIVPPESLNKELNAYAGERMEPEGGALPPLAETTFLTSDLSPSDAHGEAEIVTDQNSSVLIDVVQELLRYMGACEDDNNESFGDVQQTLNITTLLETSGGPDIRGELKRCVAQLKEEVAHIFAISRRNENPATYAHLQDEIRSLEQQIASSDNQLKSMRAFVEEQAAERELERDEFSRQIGEHNEVLKLKERQLMTLEQLKTDVEHYDQQLQETTKALKKSEEDRCRATANWEEEKNKVWTMRDVISELEKQIANRSEELEAVKQHNGRLQDKLMQLGELSLEAETATSQHSELLAYVAKLEEEVTSLRQRVEAANIEGVAAVRAGLRDLEFVVARNTKDMEAIIVTANALSSASEELSHRELIDATRCHTPDEMRTDLHLGLEEDVERLKERLVKHTRVQEVAVKKLREMEYQSKKVDELQVEIEVAQQKLEAYLYENSTLKAKIEEQRPKVLQKQLLINMEHRTQQLEKDLEAALDACRSKEQLLLESRKREERLVEAISAQEALYRSEYSRQNIVKDELNAERQRAEAATARLQELSELPNVVNVLLTKKNEEIDILKQQVATIEQTPSYDFNSTRKSQSSTASSMKRVKFSVPESFVESITPIPLEGYSVMRDGFQSHNDCSFIAPLSVQCLPSGSISSIAALQLSPRGFGARNLPLSLTDSSSSISHPVPLPGEFQAPTDISLPMSPNESNVPSNLNLELQSARNEIIALKTDMQLKCDACDSSEKLIDELKRKIIEYENKVKEITGTLQDKDGVLKEKLSEVEILSKALSTMQSNFEDLNQQYGLDLSLFKKNGLEGLPTKAELVEVKNNIIERQNKVEQLGKQVVLLLDELKQTTDVKDNMQSELERLRSERNLLIDDLKTEKENRVRKASEADAHIEEAVRKLTNQQEDTAALKETLRIAYEELDALKNERNEKEESLEQQLRGKQEELDNLQLILSDKESQVINAQKGTEEQQLKIDSLYREKEMLVLQLARKENELDSIQKLLAVKNEEIVSVKKENDEKLAVFKSRLEKDKDLLDLERDRLTFVLGELEKFNEDKAKLDDGIKVRMEEIADLRGRLEVEEQERKVLEEKVLEQNDVIRCHFMDLQEKSRLLLMLQNELKEQRTKSEGLVAPSERKLFVRAGGDASNTETAVENNQEVFSLREQVKILEKVVQTLQERLQREKSRFEEDANIMASLRIGLEKCLDKNDHLQRELVAARKRSDDFADELRQLTLQMRADSDSKQACLSREEELMRQLFAAQSENRKLNLIINTQNLQIETVSQLRNHDINISRIRNEAGPRLVRSAGDGAENCQEWRLRITRLESYRKSLIWQKRYLLLSNAQNQNHLRFRRRSKFRTAAFLIIALFRMKFLVRRWRSRLPFLPPASSGNERRIGFTSPPQ